jgi:O-methyltransferase
MAAIQEVPSRLEPHPAEVWPASNGLDMFQPDRPFYRSIGRRCLRLIRPLALPFLARLQARVSSGVDASSSAQVLRQVFSAQQAINVGLGTLADTVQILERKVDGLTPSSNALIEQRDAPLVEELLLRFSIVAPDTQKMMLRHYDPVRAFSIALALQTIQREGLAGDMAEVGVFRGDTSHLINLLCPDKRLYLFDTFDGFPAKDLENRADARFSNTSEDYVKSRFADLTNIVFRKGYFPDTAVGLEDLRFCFVMLDADLYKPTLAGMEFFYSRMVPGGYIFAHDYTSHESDRAVSRALDGFLADKPEKLIELPDPWGSAVLRKI